MSILAGAVTVSVYPITSEVQPEVMWERACRVALPLRYPSRATILVPKLRSGNGLFLETLFPRRVDHFRNALVRREQQRKLSFGRKRVPRRRVWEPGHTIQLFRLEALATHASLRECRNDAHHG